MNNFSKQVLAFAVTGLIASGAMAEGRWPNWYVGLHGSLMFVDTVDTDDNPVVNSYDSDMGVGYGASIGYRPALQNSFLRNLRFEAEWNYMRAGLDKVDSVFGDFAGHGRTIANTAMGNVYYDLVMHDQQRKAKPLVPYLGAGVGWADVKLQNTDTTLGNINTSDQVLAYQFMAGLSYAPEFIPFTEWSLGYRFFDSVDPEFSYIGGSKFSVDMQSHNLEAGVRFLF